MSKKHKSIFALLAIMAVALFPLKSFGQDDADCARRLQQYVEALNASKTATDSAKAEALKPPCADEAPQAMEGIANGTTTDGRANSDEIVYPVRPSYTPEQIRDAERGYEWNRFKESVRFQGLHVGGGGAALFSEQVSFGGISLTLKYWGDGYFIRLIGAYREVGGSKAYTHGTLGAGIRVVGQDDGATQIALTGSGYFGKIENANRGATLESAGFLAGANLQQKVVGRFWLELDLSGGVGRERSKEAGKIVNEFRPDVQIGIGLLFH